MARQMFEKQTVTADLKTSIKVEKPRVAPLGFSFSKQ